MVKFIGFETKKEAMEYRKNHGGYLTYAYTATGRKSHTYNDYMFAVHLGGLNQEKYPYCLQWNMI